MGKLVIETIEEYWDAMDEIGKLIDRETLSEVEQERLDELETAVNVFQKDPIEDDEQSNEDME